ncbi:CPBP family intramembrane metalloprotease [bacterium LRH843]|nr:CPBP family intramembrane metalloprotease [bacterium LRH843]
MTDRGLMINVYMSQVVMLVLACGLGFFIFDSWEDVLSIVKLNIREIFYIGGGAAAAVVFFQLLLRKYVPESWLDDGGLNERIFKQLSIPEIFGVCLLVSISEELLFRAVLQTAIGLVPASLIFALIHFRYLRKPVLFFSIIFASFLLGVIFQWTGNILVTMMMHFLVNTVLGCFIRMTMSNGKEGE